jgi:hypothetical protein
MSNLPGAILENVRLTTFDAAQLFAMYAKKLLLSSTK